MWDSENMGRRGGAAWERSVRFRSHGALSLGLRVEIKVWTFLSREGPRSQGYGWLRQERIEGINASRP